MFIKKKDNSEIKHFNIMTLVSVCTRQVNDKSRIMMKSVTNAWWKEASTTEIHMEIAYDD
jgi:hypothetical protein